jgi:uncharacterized protein YeaO (DUF488 family)
MDVRVKRVYEPAVPGDGYRVLIERLWPRGISRTRAALDEWERDLPPSRELRQWFGHEPRRFEEFRRRYIEELREQRPRIASPRLVAAIGTLTLVLLRPRHAAQRRRRARRGAPARTAEELRATAATYKRRSQ